MQCFDLFWPEKTTIFFISWGCAGAQHPPLYGSSMLPVHRITCWHLTNFLQCVFKYNPPTHAYGWARVLHIRVMDTHQQTSSPWFAHRRAASFPRINLSTYSLVLPHPHSRPHSYYLGCIIRQYFRRDREQSSKVPSMDASILLPSPIVLNHLAL